MSTTRTPQRQGKRRRETVRPLYATIAGVIVIGLIVGYIALSVQAPRGVPLLGFKTVYAVVPDSGNLRIHSEVRINGARAGEVVDVKPYKGKAKVQMKLDPGQLDKIPADTKVAIRGKGLLGARFVELQRGKSSTALAENATMPAAANPLTLSVGDALETFDTETRGALGSMLGEMGRGVLGRGRGLNQAIQVQPRTDTQLTAAFNALRKEPTAVQALVPSMASAAAATDAGKSEITGLLRPGAAAAKPFADHNPAIRSTLDEAPSTLAAAQPALDDGQRLLVSARHLATAAARTLPDAPSGLRATQALLRDSHTPLAKADTLLQRVRPAVPAVLKITSSVSPLLRPLQRAFSDLTPAAKVMGEYGCDIVNFGGNWRSVLNQAVAGTSGLGPLTAFRVEVLASPESIAGFGKNTDASQDSNRYTAPCKYAYDQVFPVNPLSK